MAEWLLQQALSLLQTYQNVPAVAKLLLVMGLARAIFKPLFGLLRSLVDYTTSTKDNEWLDSVVNSKAYQLLSLLLDYSLSVKLPQIPADPAK